jgi:YHS domain-containing protein
MNNSEHADPKSVSWIKVISTRLRFLLAFALVFVVVGQWERVQSYWSRLIRGPGIETAISSDTEFFCPMDPGVLSDWPSKCPICNMTLVRRKRGDATPLPDGVVARMQFSPYRLYLGGIRTRVVDYAPLVKVVELPGHLISSDKAHPLVEAEAFWSEQQWILKDQRVELTLMDGLASKTIEGIVKEVRRTLSNSEGPGKIQISLANHDLSVPIGTHFRVSIKASVDQFEPFRSQPSVPPVLVKNEPRRLYACMDHPEIVRDTAGRCPKDQTELMGKSLTANQRVRWWCPMHPKVTADHLGEKCQECGGMVLVPRLISYRLPGTVLAVPASSVIDDGRRAIVYLDRGDGMFDATIVKLGTLCNDTFPVVEGLAPGDHVAEQGAFLIDAETRLNANLASSYFGSGKVDATKDSHVSAHTWSDELPTDDRAAAIAQKLCPVTKKPLGSMGTPIKVEIKGRKIFLCCDGCTEAIQANPDRYLKAADPSKTGANP